MNYSVISLPRYLSDGFVPDDGGQHCDMLFPYNAANAGIGVTPNVFGYDDEVSLIHVSVFLLVP